MAIVNAALDTDILVDIFRNHPPAMQWFHSQTGLIFEISHIVRMEMVIGAPDRAKQQKTLQLLTRFDAIETT